jgi:hypothetical protein
VIAVDVRNQNDVRRGQAGVIGLPHRIDVDHMSGPDQLQRRVVQRRNRDVTAGCGNLVRRRRGNLGHGNHQQNGQEFAHGPLSGICGRAFKAPGAC